MSTEAASGTRRLLWFVAIWAASVVVATGGVYLLKLLLRMA